MIEEYTTAWFANFHIQLKALFIIYADFIYIAPKIQMYDKKDDESYTNMYRTRIDYENNDKVLCCYDDINLVKFIKAKAQFTSL